MKPVFAANWKMNMSQQEVVAFCDAFSQCCGGASPKAEIWIAPPFTLIPTLRERLIALKLEKTVRIGAQNCHWLAKGAHTGEISPPMLVEFGVHFVIVGHSERRQFYGETNAGVARRARGALDHGLSAIVCLGESEAEYKSGKTEEVVLAQLTESLAGIGPDDTSKLIVAYEPVWAIGTGLAADASVAQRVHRLIRTELQSLHGSNAASIPLLYGGSVTPANISGYCLEQDINGALVGGASLDPHSFWSLIQAGSRG